MGTWVIPYIDQPARFWQRLSADYGAHIREVYFPMPGGITGSGRSAQPGSHLRTFLEQCPLAKSVLLNPVILQHPLAEIVYVILAALQTLADEFGVNSVVVTHPHLPAYIKEALPDYRVTASVLMGIEAPAQVIALQDSVDTIVPASHLCRDLAALQRLRAAFSGEIRLMVNEACLPHCVYRNQHFYEMGYGAHAPESLCQPLLEREPWLRLTGAWILPQHVHYFAGLYDSLKLAGRVTLQDPVKYMDVLSAYIEGRRCLPRDIGGGPASVLAPLDMPDSLFEHILHCDKQCYTCSICRSYYAEAVH